MQKVSLSFLNDVLMFQNNYVTERDIVLKVIKPNIYVLTDNGFEQSQNYFNVWYDSMNRIVNIFADVAEKLSLSVF